MNTLNTLIVIAADNLAVLRRVDVYRVLWEAPEELRETLAEHISAGRPDLGDEVSEVLAELN